ncbi:MAG: hypothetical protein OXH68_15220 [Gammaproteobacteria bacterium]|nr:hypothetical protein [Gammaproteobacteria bacterium]
MIGFRNRVEIVEITDGIEHRYASTNDFAAGGKERIRDLLLGDNGQLPLSQANTRLDVRRPPNPPASSFDIVNVELQEPPLTMLTGDAEDVNNNYYFAINTGSINNFIAFPTNEASSVLQTPTLFLAARGADVKGINPGGVNAGDGAFFQVHGWKLRPRLTQIKANSAYLINWFVQVAALDLFLSRVLVEQERGSAACFEVRNNVSGTDGNDHTLRLETTTTNADNGKYTMSGSGSALIHTYEFLANITVKEAFDLMVASADSPLLAHRFFGDSAGQLFNADGDTREFRFRHGKDPLTVEERSAVDSVLDGPPLPHRALLNRLSGYLPQKAFTKCRMRMGQLTASNVTQLRAVRPNPTVSSQEYGGEWDTTNPNPADVVDDGDGGTIGTPEALALDSTMTSMTEGTLEAHTKRDDEMTCKFENFGNIQGGLYGGARWYMLDLVPSGTEDDDNQAATIARDYLAEHRSNSHGRLDVDTRLVRSYPPQVELLVPVTIGGSAEVVADPTGFGWFGVPALLDVPYPSGADFDLDDYINDPGGDAAYVIQGSVPTGWAALITGSVIRVTPPRAGGTARVTVRSSSSSENMTKDAVFTFTSSGV